MKIIAPTVEHVPLLEALMRATLTETLANSTRRRPLAHVVLNHPRVGLPGLIRVQHTKLRRATCGRD